MRIGQGFDAHAFRDGGRLMLGGVHVAYDRSLAAHSDGDVLLHAVCDALLGAAGLGDIGSHFPDTDPSLEGIDSRILLRRVTGKLQALGLRASNIDATVVAQVPRLAPYVDAMRGTLAEDLGMAVERVSVKATTTEHLGFTGREEGIAAFAVALLDEPAG
ncbi:MAG: 2-C-methyl-D-erythritol 2,4-cyclodiphosphate synthase [Gammaproteobacteria bacterium]